MLKVIRRWAGLLVLCASIGIVLGVIAGTALIVARGIEALAR